MKKDRFSVIQESKFERLTTRELQELKGGEHEPQHGQDGIGYYYKIYNEETGEYEYWSMGDFA